jgi:hypothetical protein
MPMVCGRKKCWMNQWRNDHKTGTLIKRKKRSIYKVLKLTLFIYMWINE